MHDDRPPWTSARESASTTLENWGWRDASITRIGGDASRRSYFRLEGRWGRAIFMDASQERDSCVPFVSVAQFLRKHGFSAPEIFAVDFNAGFLLLEDLGDQLFSKLATNPERISELHGAATDMLASLHEVGNLGPAASVAHSVDTLVAEVSLFYEWYVPIVMRRTLTESERSEFRSVWMEVATAIAALDVLVMRDFHGGNLVWLPTRAGVARVGLLDFQDAASGHVAYDLTSLMHDIRIDVPEPLADKLADRYLDMRRGQGRKIDTEGFKQALVILSVQRNLRIIGVLARLAIRDGKPGFLPEIARAWRYVSARIGHPSLAKIRLWLDKVVPISRRVVPAVLQGAQQIQVASALKDLRVRDG